MKVRNGRSKILRTSREAADSSSQESCPHCGARLERGDDGFCNKCGEHWPGVPVANSLRPFRNRKTELREQRRAAKVKRRQGGANLNPLRLDPSRTSSLRRAMSAELRRKFARLKGKIWKLIAEEDALGLGQPAVANLAVADLDQAAALAHPDPTLPQREAGNYQKGHVRLHGLDIAIETAKGVKRKPYLDKVLSCHYGYIKARDGIQRSEADGDHVDVFLGPYPESELVFIVDQYEGNRFDEHKVMLGFRNAKEAKAAYLANYPDDWQGFGGMKALTMPAFKQWLTEGDTKRPICKQLIVNSVPDIRQQEDWDCGVAVMQSVCQALGARHDREHLIALLRSNPSDGTPAAGFIRAGRLLNLEVSEIEGWQQLVRAIRRRELVVCPIQAGGDGLSQGADQEGHYIIVEDITNHDGLIWLQDPVKGKRWQTKEQWLEGWHDRDADGQAYRQWGVAFSRTTNNESYFATCERQAGHCVAEGQDEILEGLPKARSYLKLAQRALKVIKEKATIKLTALASLAINVDVIPIASDFAREALLKGAGQSNPLQGVPLQDVANVASKALAWTWTKVKHKLTSNAAAELDQAADILLDLITVLHEAMGVEGLELPSREEVLRRLQPPTENARFHRPENYDSIKSLAGGYVMGAGANDWEVGWSAVGIHRGDPRQTEPIEWSGIDHSGCPGCHGANSEDEDGPPSKEAKRQCRDWAEKIAHGWVKNRLPTVGKGVTGNRWEFHTSQEKIDSFKGWLADKFGDELTGQDDEQLWLRYASQGYVKGQGRAWDDVKGGEYLKGKDELDFYLGGREQFLRDSFGRAETVNKVKLLAGRCFDDLEGVTESMSTKMGRVLADGLVQGQNPREVARKLSKECDLGRDRALVIAKTELIRCHAEGQLDALEDLGVDEVGAMVEWSTSGKGNVCPQCADLEGAVFSIADARGLLPRHPSCACAWLPADVDEEAAPKETASRHGKAKQLVENANKKGCNQYKTCDASAEPTPAHLSKLKGNFPKASNATLQDMHDRLSKGELTVGFDWKVSDAPAPTAKPVSPSHAVAADLTPQHVEGAIRGLAAKDRFGTVHLHQLYEALGSPPVAEMHRHIEALWQQGKISPEQSEGRFGTSDAEERTIMVRPNFRGRDERYISLRLTGNAEQARDERGRWTLRGFIKGLLGSGPKRPTAEALEKAISRLDKGKDYTSYSAKGVGLSTIAPTEGMTQTRRGGILHESLKESYKTKPQDIPPIAVLDIGDKYIIYDGHHRYQAAIDAGITQVNVIVLKGNRWQEQYEKDYRGRKVADVVRDKGFVGNASFFATCERDDKGHCEAGSTVPEEELAATAKHLTEVQAAALKDYTEEGHETLNRSLRESKGKPKPEIRERVKVLDEAIANAPKLSKPMTVLRGIEVAAEDVDKFTADMDRSARTGKPIANHGYVSTTLDPEVAAEFSIAPGEDRRVIHLIIQARHGIYLEHLTGNSGEKEFLLARGTKFKVGMKSTEIKYGKLELTYHLEQVL